MAQDVDAKIAELKAATREANETLKALKQAKRDYDKAVQEAWDQTHRWRDEMTKKVLADLDTVARGVGTRLADQQIAIESAMDARLRHLIDLLTKPLHPTEAPMSIEEMVAVRTGSAMNFTNMAPETQAIIRRAMENQERA